MTYHEHIECDGCDATTSPGQSRDGLLSHLTRMPDGWSRLYRPNGSNKDFCPACTHWIERTGKVLPETDIVNITNIANIAVPTDTLSQESTEDPFEAEVRARGG